MHRIGTDILLISRIRRACADGVGGFPKGVFTDREIAESAKREDPERYLAVRFAGKEAIFKALALPPVDIRLDDIEILSAETGRPTVRLLGPLAVLAEDLGVIDIDVSLSWDTDYAVAMAVTEFDEHEHMTSLT